MQYLRLYKRCVRHVDGSQSLKDVDICWHFLDPFHQERTR
jgi:hypothetical protein